MIAEYWRTRIAVLYFIVLYCNVHAIVIITVTRRKETKFEMQHKKKLPYNIMTWRPKAGIAKSE
jgi:hypothetical protein